MLKLSEKELILSARQGNRQAFDQLTRQYYHQVFNITFRLWGDYHQADEIAQDVFVQAFKGMETFKFNRRFLIWLYQITVDLSRNKIKKMSTDNRLNVSSDESYSVFSDTDREILDKELNTLIQCALNTLEFDAREVIVLRDIQQCAYDEIAQVLGISLETVKSRLHQVRWLLANILEEVM
jgi:RNA polymerase sigma-70 factor, ECF subfamily